MSTPKVNITIVYGDQFALELVLHQAVTEAALRIQEAIKAASGSRTIENALVVDQAQTVNAGIVTIELFLNPGEATYIYNAKYEGTGVFGPYSTPIVIEPKQKSALSFPWAGAMGLANQSQQSGLAVFKRVEVQGQPADPAFQAAVEAAIELGRQTIIDVFVRELPAALVS